MPLVRRRDPFDRMLVAQAVTERLTVASRDASVALYHDPATPILAASLQRRMPGYRALGFTRA